MSLGPKPAADQSQVDSREDARDVGDQRYREHLGAPLWAWFVMVALVLALTMAFWIPLGATAGLCCLILGLAIVTWLLLTTAPTVTVTERELRIGRIHIDADAIGLVATLDATATANARGVGADPRAFTVLRPLSASESVSLEILDDEDPHPYWLISSRDPQTLGEAIRAAQQASAASNTAPLN